MPITSQLRAALLGSGAAVAFAASPGFGGPALAAQADDLKTQIDALQSRLDQLEQQHAVADADKGAVPADAVVGGDFPGSFKLPGSDTSVAIHGYAKLDFFFDLDANLGDSFVSTGIPGNHTAAAHESGQVHLGARQSRLRFETRTPTNYGQLRTYIETDFFGANGNTNNSVGGRGNTSPNLRLRHAYGELGPVLAGQTWSNFDDIDDEPETLDFAGPQGAEVGRQGQIRFTQPYGKFTFSAAVENNNPAVTQTTAPSGASSATFTSASTNASIGTTSVAPAYMPDLTARAQYTDSWGHLSLSGVLRKFDADNGGSASNSFGPTVSQSSSTIGGGIVAGGTINIGQWIGGYFGKDQVGLQGHWGQGINRYFNTSLGTNFDAAITGAGTGAVKIRTIEQYGGFFWYLHNWTEQLRTNLIYGVQQWNYPGGVPVSISSGTPGANTQLDKVQTAYVNLIWSPVKSVNIGVEFIYGNLDKRKLSVGIQSGGDNGDAKRILASMQYLF